MIWIHGGSWFMSSGNGGFTDIYGPRYFLDRDIVLVTINYRLGPLGWNYNFKLLSMQQEKIPVSF